MVLPSSGQSVCPLGSTQQCPPRSHPRKIGRCWKSELKQWSCIFFNMQTCEQESIQTKYCKLIDLPTMRMLMLMCNQATVLGCIEPLSHQNWLRCQPTDSPHHPTILHHTGEKSQRCLEEKWLDHTFQHFSFI